MRYSNTKRKNPDPFQRVRSQKPVEDIGQVCGCTDLFEDLSRGVPDHHGGKPSYTPLEDHRSREAESVDRTRTGADREGASGEPPTRRYTVSNYTVLRTLDGSSDGTAALSRVLGTLINDLAARGVITITKS